MLKKTLHILILIIFLSACSFTKKKADNASDRYVVMLSMDGFRWDYNTNVPTPNLDRIARMGVKAEAMRPSFPTITFPNHYTIATGLYPDHHGIVQNSFYDPVTHKHFSIGDRTAVEDSSFYGGEPIWVTAEKQKLKSACFFWVGSEAAIEGIRPSYWKKYDPSITFKQQIDTVMAWLNKPESARPHLLLLYFNEPDHTGHKEGPDSEELKSMIVQLDFYVGAILGELENLPFADKIDFIVTSDHGMSNISDERKVVLDDVINMDLVDIVEGHNPNYLIKAKEGQIDKIMRSLVKAPHISAWKSAEVPERLHYGKNPRTLDIVVVADSSWSLVRKGDKPLDKGAHGYDNNNRDMLTIFYANGPDFKENYEAPVFENVNIYPLIAHILNLQPAPCDGSLDTIKFLLKESQSSAVKCTGDIFRNRQQMLIVKVKMRLI